MSSVVGHKAFQNTQTGQVWVSKFENDTPVNFILDETAEASLQALFAKVRAKAPKVIKTSKNPEVEYIQTYSNEEDVSPFEENTYVLTGDIHLSRFQ